MGLRPTDHGKLIPTTFPLFDRISFDWLELLRVAQERRPDLVELKLIIEADEQLLLQARNQALPAIDAVMLYRWNGLEGQTPSGARISSGSDQFTDWTLGVNFSVPLGLRQSRASLRRQELVIARDRANLQQGVHSMVHTLAANIRNLDQFYEQYVALKETRLAARDNLRQQLAEKRAGNFIFLNVIQAITSWGNAVSAEAQLLVQYNIELANIERQTGTILETHGIRFYEERYHSIGPLHDFWCDGCYPESIYPGANAERYPGGSKPSENAFDLSNPIDTKKDSKLRNPYDRPPLPPLPVPEAKPDDSPPE
jgi:outer membrane protein TolC